MPGLYEAMRAMPGVVRGTKRLPASIFTFRRMRGGGGWSKKLKKEGSNDATRINRVTVWMQHTSLPRKNKAVKREDVVTTEAIIPMAHQSSVQYV